MCFLQTILPIGVKTNAARRTPSSGVPDYASRTDKKLNTTIIFDPTVGVNGTEMLSCPALQQDLPNGEAGMSCCVLSMPQFGQLYV